MSAVWHLVFYCDDLLFNVGPQRHQPPRNDGFDFRAMHLEDLLQNALRRSVSDDRGSRPSVRWGNALVWPPTSTVTRPQQARHIQPVPSKWRQMAER
jgi:hypothetical protein